MATKLNVNIRTLLSNCEELAKDEANYWRLKKFIKSLDTMIEELKDHDDIGSNLKIPDYTKRLNALKILTNYFDSPPPVKSLRSKLRPAHETGDDALKEMQQLQSSKHYADLRKELLNEDQLRRRRPDESATNASGMNEAVKYYNEAQEKITEHMLSLTRNLKEQTETANRIIKKDTEIVSKSTSMADRNINSLNKETEKLAEHSRNAWKCWMWLMFAFVITVFIGMVLFMKVMKKKKV
ncbi:vesicle transport protein USE1 isoform X1 [Anastrepha obliqua]|uniref:vesicle transport protein USE1 isoform X1 n=1 Tax=Anastrepha obliqua TaxID=95512 RepID=UPI00240933DB|nr:vesicle transport protein USE1 isoform X1 [Anastrepha obliqua]